MSEALEARTEKEILDFADTCAEAARRAEVDLPHFQCRQPFPGIYLWRDSYGAYYLVDHTGTCRLRSTPHTSYLALYRPPIHIDIDPDDWAA